MEKQSSSGRDLGSVFLVAEVCHSAKKAGGGVSIVWTIPGRESTFTETWTAPCGILNASQASDLAHHIVKVVQDALLARTGIQGQLVT